MLSVGLIVTILLFALGIAIAFLIGSIPFGLIIGKKSKGIDIREHGSGNIGSTNMTRVLGVKAGLLTFALDVLKGIVAVLVMIGIHALCKALITTPDDLVVFVASSWFGTFMSAVAMGIVVIGHMYSPFLSGKGGKGIATMFGAMIPISAITAFGCLGVFIIIVLLTKRVSCGSIIAVFGIPVGMTLFRPDQIAFAIIGGFIAILIIYAHRSNIKRIVKGEEPKFSFKSSKTVEQCEKAGK